MIRRGHRGQDRNGRSCSASRLSTFTTRLSLLLLVTASLTAALSCQESDLVALPGQPTPGIQGQVRSAGVPVRATVGVERIAVPGGTPPLRATYVTGDDGRFSFSLPPGRYVAFVRISSLLWGLEPWYYGQDGRLGTGSEADTIDLVDGAGPYHADFPLGRIDAELTLPEDHLGTPIDLTFRRISPDDPGVGTDELVWEFAASTYPAHIEAPVPAGRYCVHVQGTERFEGFWLPGVPGIAGADTIVVSADLATAYQAAFTPEAAVLRCSLRGDGYSSGWATGATIRILDPDSLTIAEGSIRPGEQMNAVFTFPQRVRLVIIEGYATRFWVGGRDFASATGYDLIPGSTTVVPPITAGAIRLRWIGPEAGRRKETRMRLQDGEGLGHSSRTVVWNGDAATLYMVPPGRYRLRFEPIQPGTDAWLPQWYDRAEIADEGAWIEIAESGPVVPIELRVQNGGVIRGPLLTSWDHTFAVFATQADEYLACWRAVAPTGDGEYALCGLPDGDYKIGLTRRDFLFAANCSVPPPDSRWHGDTAAWDSATVITIRDHEVVDGIELRW